MKQEEKVCEEPDSGCAEQISRIRSIMTKQYVREFLAEFLGTFILLVSSFCAIYAVVT